MFELLKPHPLDKEIDIREALRVNLRKRLQDIASQFRDGKITEKEKSERTGQTKWLIKDNERKIERLKKKKANQTIRG